MNGKNIKKNDFNKPLLVNKTLQKSRNQNVNYYNPTTNQPNLRTKITINRTLLWKNKIKNDNNNNNKIITNEKNTDSQSNSNSETFYDYKNNKYNKMLLSQKKFSYLNGINLINKLNNLTKSEKSENNNSKYFSPNTLSSNNTNKDTNLSFSDQSFNNNIFMNNNPKATYRFLLHQASKNLNDSFSNIYKTNNKRSYSTPQNKSLNNTLNTSSVNNISINDENNTSIFKNRKELNKLGFGINLINSIKEKNLKTINISTKSENNFNEKNSRNKRINFNVPDNYTNNFISLKKIKNNNNIFNNFNYYKNINDNYNNNINRNNINKVIENYNHKRSYSNQNVENNNKFHTFQNLKTHRNLRNIYVSNEKIINLNSLNLKYYSDYINFNLENLYILENKLRNILYKLNNFQAAHNECFEWLNSFFQSNLCDNIEELFLDSNNRKNIIYFFKIELLCYCLCYDISYDNNLNKVSIILKSIFKLIHFNFLILLRFILHKTKMTSENYIWYEKLYNIIKNNLSMNLNKNDLDEYKIIQILNHNIKEIYNYYNLIIDNIYANDYFPNINEYKFPFSLDLNINKIYEKKNIIASFFYDGIKFTESYSFEDIKKFFNIFLFRIPDPNSSYIISYRINFKNYNVNNNINNDNIDNNDYNDNNNNNIDNNFYNDNNNEIYSYNNNKMINIKLKTPFNSYFLPKINSNFYKYTLVLDLDETLIYVRHSKNNKKRTLIIRPYLYEFLNRMKKIYELILFSFGTPEYVDPIINIIEKKEKYFEYKLYRQHASIAGNDFVKDLKKLGRDMNKILIVDNLPQTFKLNKENGICINAFYGDVSNDKNTLKNLAEILEDIRFDADETNDIRISLKNRENLIISKVTSNEF